MMLPFICENCGEVNFHNEDVNKYDTVYCESCSEKNLIHENIEFMYVLDSDHAQNLLKIGYTSRDPDARANEINLGTGSIPWKVAMFYETFSGLRLEQKIFKEYSEYRIDKKELFEIRIEDLIKELFTKYELIPNFIRGDYQYIKDKFLEYNDNSNVKDQRPIIDFGQWVGDCQNCKRRIKIIINHTHEFPCPFCGNEISISHKN